MGTTVVVESFERISDDNGYAVEVKVDPSGGAKDECEHYACLGEDSPPLLGDFGAADDAPGAGGQRIVGYLDALNEGKALGGEKRIYGRTPDGELAGEVWIHGDGLIEIMSLRPGGRYKIGKVLIDENGNITTPGEITGKSDTTPVKLSTHLHPTGVGPSDKPTPGT